MSFRDRLYQRARRAGRRIVLPEGADPRVQEAARRLVAEQLGAVEVLGDVRRDPRRDACARLLCERRPDRFPTGAAAASALDHPLTFGAALVAIGAADAMVGGVVHPTGETIRAALWTVGTAPGVATVSGAFYMVREDTVLTFTDQGALKSNPARGPMGPQGVPGPQGPAGPQGAPGTRPPGPRSGHKARTPSLSTLSTKRPRIA